MKRRLAVTAIAAFGVWLAWPAPIDPIPFHPMQDQGLTGVFAPNDRLDRAVRHQLASGIGPEDVAVDSEGRLYGGLQDGRIIRYTEGQGFEDFAYIEGGRPLGLHFDKRGQLIVADGYKGLLSVDTSGKVSVLTTQSQGIPFTFTDDLDIASDGRIYFSDASARYAQADYKLDMLATRPYGRLIRYDPATKKTETLMSGLTFANGIALSKNEDFVLINETWHYKVTRYWLTGDKAGTNDVFVDNLPGFPDGISSNREGVFWLALASPRKAILDNAHPLPFVKGLMAKLPAFLQPAPVMHGIVIGLNEEGEVVYNFQDQDGSHLYMITSIEQKGDQLYLGSLEAPQIGVFTLKSD